MEFLTQGKIGGVTRGRFSRPLPAGSKILKPLWLRGNFVLSACAAGPCSGSAPGPDLNLQLDSPLALDLSCVCP